MSDGKPKATKQNLETIEEFKAVMRKLAAQRIHIGVDTFDGRVEFWKANSIHSGRSHGISRPFKTKAVR